MTESFFDHSILTSPYEYPAQYWELDAADQPTNSIVESRRRAEFLTPKKRRRGQKALIYDEGQACRPRRSSTRSPPPSSTTCTFNYDTHATDFDKAGRIPILKARMNADLHMADDLKNISKGNLVVIFGEPDIDILPAEGDGAKDSWIQVRVNGVDVFHPNTGEVRSDSPEGIACWFIDTDYNEESFFVRQAYFLGANDLYKSLKITLKGEINQEAWGTLHSPVSRPFPKPKSGRIAIKVINHLGDEVMKIFRIES